MRLKRTIVLKPEDPAWAELVAEIASVVSRRFVEDPGAIFRPDYMPSEEEPGFAFAALNRDDQMDLLAELVPWRDYECQGIGVNQQRIVIANVLDGKPLDKWLDGVFDEAVLEKDRIASFKLMVEDSQNSPDGYFFEEIDGIHLPWEQLSATAKLQYIARDAAIADVPFEPFTEVVKKTIGDAVEAALRVVLDSQMELYAIAKLLAGDGRTESTPLVEQVKDMLEYVSTLEQENERLQDREKLSEGERGVIAEDGVLSLGDLRRRAAHAQEKRREDEKSKPNEVER